MILKAEPPFDITTEEYCINSSLSWQY